MRLKSIRTKYSLIIEDPKVKELIKRALDEDIEPGDITTECCIPKQAQGSAILLAKEPCVVCGLPIFELVYQILNQRVKCELQVSDGDFLSTPQVVGTISGPLASILTGERLALNFLQHLSGISTLTNTFVQACKGTKAKIFDTRKTTPCMRTLEKYAVRVGGGQNHRFGLFDQALIKDNHIAACGGVKKALEEVKKRVPKGVKIEIEVSKLDDLKEALSCGPDIILLDNMDKLELQKAIEQIGDLAIIEISGGVTLDNIKDLAALNPDRISVGGITHSARAIDFSLNIKL